MNGSLPSAIRVHESPREVRYILPRRRLDRRRLRRGASLVFTSIVLLGMCLFISFFPGIGLAQMPWLGWLFALKTVPVALIALVPLYMGLSLLFGHAEIRLHGDRLIASEHAGPFRRSRVRELISLQRFVVVDSSAERDRHSLRELQLASMMASDEGAGPRKPTRWFMHGHGNPEWLHSYAAVLTDSAGELSVLLAECERSGAMILAGGYPRAWLAALANDLSRRCQKEVHAQGCHPKEQSVPVVERHLEELEQIDLDKPPAKARLTLERFQDGLTLVLQPCREYHVAWQLYRGFLCLGVLIILLPPALIVAALLQLVPWEVCIVGSIGVLFFVPVVALAICPLVDETRSEAGIGVVGDELLLVRKGVFSSERHLWRRSQISTIRVGHKRQFTYGWAPELQIRLVNGREFGYFAGRQEAELRWLAAVLRDALKIGRTNGDCRLQ